jgi:6-phosphogluconate dehydrogenase
MESRAEIGIVGLGVMGRNLALNLTDHGFTVAIFNRTTKRVDEFLNGDGTGTSTIGAHDVAELVASLQRPRRVMLMIRAGDAVDAAIASLLPLLEPGDIIIDGGNSHYADTIRRTTEMTAAGIHYIGVGVSGGETGARYGPSLMPGGSIAAWDAVAPIFLTIAAHVDGVPCCEWIGPDGAGHYVKMVHNGIEYGDMQVIAEAYDVMRRGIGLDAGAMHEVFSRWNRGPLDSYLIEITAEIMATFDAGSDTPLLDRILDVAGQKGTGRWTVASALDLGQPITLIATAVFSRALSALHEQRATASGRLPGPEPRFAASREDVLTDLHDALYASKIVSYAQGFMLLAAAADEYGWELSYRSIASMWRGGCIIRSRFLGEVMRSYAAEPDLPNLLLADFFRQALLDAEPGWRRTVARAVAGGIPVPAYSAALAFFDGYRSERLPANLIQAQRDFFGAHTYERVDRPRGEHFHTDWTGRTPG